MSKFQIIGIVLSGLIAFMGLVFCYSGHRDIKKQKVEMSLLSPLRMVELGHFWSNFGLLVIIGVLVWLHWF